MESRYLGSHRMISVSSVRAKSASIVGRLAIEISIIRLLST